MGKTGGIRAEGSGNGRMKGDEVEGWRGEMEGAAHARGSEEAQGC